MPSWLRGNYRGFNAEEKLIIKTVENRSLDIYLETGKITEKLFFSVFVLLPQSHVAEGDGLIRALEGGF